MIFLQLNYLHKHIYTHGFISGNFRFDGNQFCEDLQKVCASQENRGKTPRKTRFDSYCTWATFLMKMKVDLTGCYHYPDEVFKYIRANGSEDIKGEIREQAYRVNNRVL